MKLFSKKTIWLQILYGVLFSFVANPYLIYNFFHSKIFVIIQITFMAFLFINAIIKYCKEDINKAVGLGYFRHNKNFFTIFLFTVVEVLFFSYLYMKYLVKKDLNVYAYILLPSGIAFLVILLVSYLIRKKRFKSIIMK